MCDSGMVVSGLGNRRWSRDATEAIKGGGEWLFSCVKCYIWRDSAGFQQWPMAGARGRIRAEERKEVSERTITLNIKQIKQSVIQLSIKLIHARGNECKGKLTHSTVAHFLGYWCAVRILDATTG